MFVAYVVVTIITIIANAAVAIADLRRHPFVLADSADVGVRPHVTAAAPLKAAGVAGLLIGLLGVQYVGIAAATGLVTFFTGALAVHVRARVFYNLAFPGTYWLLAAASLVLAIAR